MIAVPGVSGQAGITIRQAQIADPKPAVKSVTGIDTMTNGDEIRHYATIRHLLADREIQKADVASPSDVALAPVIVASLMLTHTVGAIPAVSAIRRYPTMWRHKISTPTYAEIFEPSISKTPTGLLAI